MNEYKRIAGRLLGGLLALALCAALLPLCAALAQWALGRRIKADEEEAA